MSTSEAIHAISVEAGADLSAGQYLFVEIATDGQIDLVGSAGGSAIGVLYDKPSAAGRAARVVIGGVAKVEAGGTVTAADKVQSTAAGKAITAASSDHVLGRALTSGVDGDIIRVLLTNNHILA